MLLACRVETPKPSGGEHGMRDREREMRANSSNSAPLSLRLLPRSVSYLPRSPSPDRDRGYFSMQFHLSLSHHVHPGINQQSCNARARTHHQARDASGGISSSAIYSAAKGAIPRGLYLPGHTTTYLSYLDVGYIDISPRDRWGLTSWPFPPKAVALSSLSKRKTLGNYQHLVCTTRRPPPQAGGRNADTPWGGRSAVQPSLLALFPNWGFGEAAGPSTFLRRPLVWFWQARPA